MSTFHQTPCSQASADSNALLSNPTNFDIDEISTLGADLIHHNTMRLACQADRLINLGKESDIAPTIAQLAQMGLPMFVLSGGSNVILPKVLNATVLHPTYKGINILSEDEDGINIEVMGGENWHELVVYTVNQGWYGLENLALIPGLVGASPVQNIGAYGVELKDTFVSCRAMNVQTLEEKEFSLEDCNFDYRNSVFKN